MSEPATVRESLRDRMPLTARWVDRLRAERGVAEVNDFIRRALAGEPGVFYAIEAGHVLGMPFPAGSEFDQWQQYAVVTACRFAGFIAAPVERGTHGTD